MRTHLSSAGPVRMPLPRRWWAAAACGLLLSACGAAERLQAQAPARPLAPPAPVASPPASTPASAPASTKTKTKATASASNRGEPRSRARGGASPASALRPIGTYRRGTAGAAAPSADPARASRGGSASLRRIAYMQADGQYSMPGAGNESPSQSPVAPGLQAPPGGRTATEPPNTGPASSPQSGAPSGLRPAPRGGNPSTPPSLANPPGGSGASPSDLEPMRAPSLGSQWATTGNCRLVTPASGYRASFYYDACGTPVVPAGAYPPSMPYAVAPATTMPNAPAAMAVTNMPVGWSPLISLGQDRYNVQLGRGIIGQPVAYVPGQWFRNFLRYVSP